MKQLSTAFQDHLDSGSTTLAWCWRITLADGRVFGFTDHDAVLVFDGTIFDPESGFIASEIRSGTGLEVDAQSAAGALSSLRITEDDLLAGLWDGAGVEVWRVNWADVTQRSTMRRGVIGQVRRGTVAFDAEIRSISHVLNQTTGRVYQPTCDAILGDTRCKAVLGSATYTHGGTVAAVAGDRGFTVTGIDTYDDDWFALGDLTWLTGANAGRLVKVSAHKQTPVVVTLRSLPIDVIEVGDTFTIVAGCDKRFETCKTKFANVINFRGFPDIPPESTALVFASKEDLNDGSVI